MSTCERQPVYTPIVDRREICFGVVRADFHQKYKKKNPKTQHIFQSFCEHVFTSHWILNVWLVVYFIYVWWNLVLCQDFFFFLLSRMCFSFFLWALGGHIPNGIIIHREILSRSNPFPFRKLQFYFFFQINIFRYYFYFLSSFFVVCFMCRERKKSRTNWMRSSGSIKRHFRRSFSVSIFIQIFFFWDRWWDHQGAGGTPALLSFPSCTIIDIIVHLEQANTSLKMKQKNHARLQFDLFLSLSLHLCNRRKSYVNGPIFFFFFGLHHWPHLTSFIPLCNQHIDLAASFRNVLIWIFCWCCCLFRFDRWAGSGAGVSSAPCITATVKCAAKTIFTCSYSHPLSFKGTASLFFLIFHFLSPFALALLRRFKKKHIGECAFFALDFHCVGWLVIGCVQGD